MRDYQPKKSPYAMERSVYMRTLALVRDYPRMRRAYEQVVGNCASSTEEQVMRAERLGADIRAVHTALAHIPQEYHAGILDNIIFRVPMIRIEGACEKTWSRWRSRFLWEIANQMHLIDRDGK